MQTNCNTSCNTRPEKYILETVINNLKESDAGYLEVRECMNMLFEQNIVKEVVFEIQESHVTCTVSCDPKRMEFPKFFEQGSIYRQARGNGKTEQEAFHSALFKIALFMNLT